MASSLSRFFSLDSSHAAFAPEIGEAAQIDEFRFGPDYNVNMVWKILGKSE